MRLEARLPLENVHVPTSAPDWNPQAVLWRAAAHWVLQSSDCTTFIQIQSDETWLRAHRVCISHTSQSGRLLRSTLQKLALFPKDKRAWLQKKQTTVLRKKNTSILQVLICSTILNITLHFYPPTCPVAGVVEVDGKGTRLVLGLPGRRGTVLVVGVSVVVVDVLARQHGGPWRAAHGRGDKSVGESCASIFHDFAGFIHDLERTCNTGYDYYCLGLKHYSILTKRMHFLFQAPSFCK